MLLFVTMADLFIQVRRITVQFRRAAAELRDADVGKLLVGSHTSRCIAVILCI